MRGRSLEQQSKEERESDKRFSKLKEEPHLSGAYIRSLVKQLSSSRTKDPMNPKDHPDCYDDGDGFSAKNLTIFGKGFSETPQNQLPQQHKKQVRRRLHTSRPYQERLLNMAEARREIVTALKFHRAAMKQANEQQEENQQHQNQQQLQQQEQESQTIHVSPSACFEDEAKIKSWRNNPRIYQSSTANFSYFGNPAYPSFSYPPPPNPFCWPPSPIPPPPLADNLNFTLPNQTLGLNLNLYDFNNIDTTLYHNSYNPSVYPSSSPSSSSSPSFSIATEDVHSCAISQEVVGPPTVADASDLSGGGSLHPAMDYEEIAEIKSIGEQHQMEWNDTMNLVTSAWWLKFSKTMELGPEEGKQQDDEYNPFDEFMEFPAWLNANESCLQQHFNDCYSEDYLHEDHALPCMDIEEIEGMDGEWLS
ncbi:hypothetical protein CFOL_v3_17485 [Cephalotus follicularis]|uniref:Uncharacterized protein n=1 Tax=Cephalotus follicularis TaxID=3775 RepID=A0A1Q3C1K0_CEPFO|nr:hypothetical protein CFOL_v3_17485 [Cephalotus follicularis]